KEHSDITPIVEKYREYKALNENIDEAKEMLADSSLDKEEKAMIEDEISDSKKQIETVSEELKILLLPKDPNDDKNVIIEIRGGTGGDEAALFASDLLRMYSMYAETKRWKVEILSSNETDIGGFKEVTFSINGDMAYSRLKFESGVHRVQRIPSTESGGRIHTSAATVAVLPEVEDVEVEINQNDLRIDVFRAGGPGGQCVNTTDSAVRITHIPTGVVVSCQDEKSQHKNKDKAMKILRSRVYDMMIQQQNDAISQERKSQVGSGDRSERIRTYNYPQGRVTDHRIGLTLHRLDSIMNGDLDEIIDALITSDQSEKLKMNE
ncbi:MAG: peptide chain release factor 1, partial [Clostridia bacterium]|nr:peptide chain release factor 1 [Clostridia bacterium]